MALPGARNQYLKTQIETASKEQLVVMLFDGIIRFSEQARKAIEANQIEESHHSLMRAQAIVMELICTVDKEKGGEVAGNLMGLHAYAFNCLIVANMKKDLTKIDEVQKIYRQLREGWVGAMDSLGIGSNASAAAAPSAPVSASAAKPAAPVAKAPVVPFIPKAPPSTAFAPKAPLPTAAPKAVPPAQAKPPIGPGGSGIMASAAPAAAPGAAPKLNAYGMGKTAMMGALAHPAAPVAAPSTVAPAAPVPPAAKPAVAASSVTAKQAAMLNA